MQKEMMNYAVNNSKTIYKSTQKDSLAVIGLSLGLDLKRSCTKLTIAKQDGSWSRSDGENTDASSKDLDIRYSVDTNVLERGELRSKAGGQISMHFNDSTQKH